MTGPHTQSDRIAEPRAPGDDRGEESPTAETEDADQAPGNNRELTPATRKRLTVIGVIVVLAAVAFGGNYLLYASSDVSTDNAQVDGVQIQISAPATGTLVEWEATQGATVRENEVVGRIQVGGGAGPLRLIRAPESGTVGLSAAVAGARVSEGATLATIYNLGEIYATARIDETDIGEVRPGALVDIEVDAYPDLEMTGLVKQIQAGSAGVFSVLPEFNSTGNAQDVTQVIPVRIAFVDTRGVLLVPGMSMTVHIRKD